MMNFETMTGLVKLSFIVGTALVAWFIIASVLHFIKYYKEHKQVGEAATDSHHHTVDNVGHVVAPPSGASIVSDIQLVKPKDEVEDDKDSN